MRRQSFWNHRFTRTRIKSEKVQLPEMLFGYILGPMGASISGSIFGSILQSYFTDVLRLDLRFLSRLQLVSTVLIVAANLLVGQLIERTRQRAHECRCPGAHDVAALLGIAAVSRYGESVDSAVMIENFYLCHYTEIFSICTLV